MSALGEFRVGDKIKRKKLRSNFDHYGIVVEVWPAVRVVHNVKFEGVTEVSFAKFASGLKVNVVERAPRGSEHVVAERARRLKGQAYDFFEFNCEHMANLAARGQKVSGQIAGGVLALGSLAFLAWATSSGSSGRRYDLSLGQYRDSRGRFTR